MEKTKQPARERFPHLRQSHLSDFDSCPLSSRFKMEWEQDWDSHPAARGHIGHQVWARCLEEMARQGTQTIETDVALAILHERIRQHDVPIEQVVALPMRELKDLYWVTIKFAHDNTWSIQNLVAVEERLRAPVAYPKPDGGFYTRVLTGQIDALFIEGMDAEHAIVVDFKDTWALPPPTEVSFEGYFQQRFYSWLVMKVYPSVQQVTLREFYVRYSEPREVVVTRERLTDIEQELSALAERFDRAYDEEHWKPSPGKHCSYCTRPGACPIPTFARGEGAIEDAETAEKMAARLVVAKATYDQAYKALKAWADKHGPVPIKASKGKRVFGYKRSQRTEKPDKDTLALAIKAAGADLDVESLYVTKTATRFSQHTPEPEDPDAQEKEILEALEASLAERTKK